MVASSGISGLGGTFTWNTYVVAELTRWGDIDISVDSIDVSHANSDSATKEFIPGLVDSGSVLIEGNFISSDTTGQVAMITDALARTQRAFIVTGPTAAAYSWSGNGFLTNVKVGAPFDNKIPFSATLKIDGVITPGITASADITTLTFADSTGAVTPVPSPFAGGTYIYSATINTASGYIKATVTDATATSIVATCLGVSHTLATAVQSEQIAVGAADTITTLTITVTDSGKVPVTYTVYVTRP